jgi:hypothetical protein
VVEVAAKAVSSLSSGFMPITFILKLLLAQVVLVVPADC